MEGTISSAEEIARVKLAIEICNSREIKKEILCTAESDLHKITCASRNAKKEWGEIIETKVTSMLGELRVTEHLKEKVLGIVLLTGMKMLIWAKFHEITLGVSRDCCFNLFNSTLFTQRGTIDKKEAANKWMEDASLNTKQKYKLACLYCLEDHIAVLYRQMTEEDKKEFYHAENSHRIRQPSLVKFWSYFLMNDIEKLSGERNMNEYRLETAVESGSLEAVEYCLEETRLLRQRGVLGDAALTALRCRFKPQLYPVDDVYVFENERYIYNSNPWVPMDYYVDILNFLLSKMVEEQQMEFFRQVVERETFAERRYWKVLQCFLNWPYQNNFMRMAGLMWDFLQERHYSVFLLNICNSIEGKGKSHLRFGEEMIYDYRKLLREFWIKSPERFKRYVVSDLEEEIRDGEIVLVANTTRVRLLINLLSLKNFTYKDRQTIKLILASATEDEKEKIFSSQLWRDHCFMLIEKAEWDTLKRLSTFVFLTKEEAVKFRKELCFTEKAMKTCIGFVKKGEWNAAESFLKWSSLPDKEIHKLKAEMIYSEEGRRACVDLISRDKKLKAVDIFIKWCLLSGEEIKAFRREIVFSNEGIDKFSSLVLSNQLELAIEFVVDFLSSEGDIKEIKKKLADRCGDLICRKLISSTEWKIFCPFGIPARGITFKGGRWKDVEKFLNWCFASDEEIKDFKKNVLINESRVDIHFSLIQCNRWEDAEKFFAWLGLSDEEKYDLKKDTLFNDSKVLLMFYSLLRCEKECISDEEKREGIDQLLRWFLTDKKTAMEFLAIFKKFYGKEVTEKFKDEFEIFYLAIERRFRDLDNE